MEELKSENVSCSAIFRSPSRWLEGLLDAIGQQFTLSLSKNITKICKDRLRYTDTHYAEV